MVTLRTFYLFFYIVLTKWLSGNNCFVNVALQCLLHSPGVPSLLREKKSKSLVAAYFFEIYERNSEIRRGIHKHLIKFMLNKKENEITQEDCVTFIYDLLEKLSDFFPEFSALFKITVVAVSFFFNK